MKEKKEIISRLAAALNALAKIPVYDEQSCLNKGGAMQFVREAAEILSECEVVEKEETTDEE